MLMQAVEAVLYRALGNELLPIVKATPLYQIGADFIASRRGLADPMFFPALMQLVDDGALFRPAYSPIVGCGPRCRGCGVVVWGGEHRNRPAEGRPAGRPQAGRTYT